MTGTQKTPSSQSEKLFFLTLIFDNEKAFLEESNNP
jgi:hypothetical protein